jgi:hypothetical protein
MMSAPQSSQVAFTYGAGNGVGSVIDFRSRHKEGRGA